VSFTPPPKVRQNAQEGIRLWKLNKKRTGKSCATLVGIMRGYQLAKGRPVTSKTLMRMYKFQRHQKSKRNEPPKCGKISWLLWGGDAGISWAKRELKGLGKI
jgi:hypothetical protein